MAGGYPDGEERDVLAGRSFDAGVLDVLGVVQESQPVEGNLGGVDLLVALEAGPPGTDDLGAPGAPSTTVSQMSESQGLSSLNVSYRLSRGGLGSLPGAMVSESRILPSRP